MQVLHDSLSLPLLLFRARALSIILHQAFLRARHMWEDEWWLSTSKMLPQTAGADAHAMQTRMQPSIRAWHKGRFQIQPPLRFVFMDQTALLAVCISCGSTLELHSLARLVYAGTGMHAYVCQFFLQRHSMWRLPRDMTRQLQGIELKRCELQGRLAASKAWEPINFQETRRQLNSILEEEERYQFCQSPRACAT